MFVKMGRVMCFIVTALLILLQISCQNNIEKQFLCKNEDCSEPIGMFSVKLTYTSDSPEKLSAKANDEGIILARPKDPSTKLWKVKIQDKIGFIPYSHIHESKKWKANITVKLSIPINSISNSDFNKTPTKSDRNEDLEKHIEVNDASITETLIDAINPSLPHDEVIRNESVLHILNNSSNKNDNTNVENDSNLSLDPVDETVSAKNPSSDEFINRDSTIDKFDNESLINQQQPDVEAQIESVGLKKKSHLPDIFLKLENVSLEVNESRIIKDVKKSEIISENSTNINRELSENSTQETDIEKDISSHEISNISESSLSTTETLNDTSLSPKDVKDAPIENLAKNNTALSTFAEAEVSSHVVSGLDEVQVIVEQSLESNVSTPVDSSLNGSAKLKMFNNINDDVKQSADDVKTVQNFSAHAKTVTSNETSRESNDEIPIRGFSDVKESIVRKKSDTFFENISISIESEKENVASEEINTSLNAPDDLNLNETETEHITEDTQKHDSTPTAISYDVYPPLNIDSTTEVDNNETSASTEEILDSNESIPIKSSSASRSSSAEDTHLSKLSESYKYIKSPPYPGMLPNIVAESQSSVTEKSNEASSQEIIEIEPEAVSDSRNQANEPASAIFNVKQKQEFDFVHSSGIKVAKDEPEPITESEIPEEKSIYEKIHEKITKYLPDISILFVGFSSSNKISEIETENEFCSIDQFCGTDHLSSHMDKSVNLESENVLELPFLGVISKEKVTYVSGILTTVLIATILLWWLMNYFNRSKKIGLLMSRINQLENKLLISTREIASLQEKLVEQDSQAQSKQNATDTKRITEVYEHKINQYKKRIVELDDKVLYLEKELENVSNSALEMHKLLENSLATQAQSKLALDEVETLRTLTENQEIQIDELKKEINSVITENECLKVDNEMNKSTIKKLEKECNAQTKKNVEVSEKNRSLTLLLDKELENNAALESDYKSEIYELRSKLEDVDMNFKRSEFQVQELQRAILDKQDTAQGFSNDVQLKIQISTLDAMNNELSGQLNEQKNARRMLEDHVGDVTKELNNLKKSFENSEKEKNQAVTKLQVLTQYFKDKEEQLHKELETKDKLSLERESKDQSLTQKLSIMREEISNLKAQNEELKKEVLDQEASYKVQLANAEQKTREHWFSLRQAERKYKESQQEAAILRNKILVLETNMSSISLKSDDKNNSGLNGDIAGTSSVLYHPSLSPDLLPYPSSSDFIPPPLSPIPSHSSDFFPPEPIYSPDERLPPLGGRRGPSPPPPISPDDNFSPPPPVMKYPSNRSHNVEPPVPGGYNRRTPPPSGRHRSQYKSRPPRSSIDSPSSGMSLESLDKSGR